MNKVKCNIFVTDESLRLESLKINDILGILVPHHIKNLFHKGNLVVSEDQGEVAILFCDLCDFDKIVLEESKNVIRFLDSLYRDFDNLCFRHKVQKIETVGKTYMACAGLKEYEYSHLLDKKNQRNSATRILDLAIEMMKLSESYVWGVSPYKKLQLKIGKIFSNIFFLI